MVYDGQVAWVRDATHQVRVCKFETVDRTVQLVIQVRDVLVAGLAVKANYRLDVTC